MIYHYILMVRSASHHTRAEWTTSSTRPLSIREVLQQLGCTVPPLADFDTRYPADSPHYFCRTLRSREGKP